MQWKRRTPLWPLFFGLGCLFILAAAAPQFWKHAHGVKPAEPAPLQESSQLVGQPKLPPVASKPIEFDELEVTVEEVDHFSFEPVVVSAGEYQDEWQVVEEPRPPLEEQPLPVRKEFNLEVLHNMRSALAKIASQLPSAAELAKFSESPVPSPEGATLESPVTPALEHPPAVFQAEIAPREMTPRVAVESAQDRLAMADTRPHRIAERHREDHGIRVVPEEFENIADVQISELERFGPLDPDLADDLADIEEVRADAEPIDDKPDFNDDESQDGEDAPSKLMESEVAHPLIRQRPLLLIEQLHLLSASPIASSWASAVLSQVKQLCEETDTTPQQAQSLLEQLAKDASYGMEEAREVSDLAVQQNWMQAAQSLQRRLGIWHSLIAAHSDVDGVDSPARQSDRADVREVSGEILLPLLGEVRLLLSNQKNGLDWHDYLLLDELAIAASDASPRDRLSRIKLAQEILSRLNDRRLTPEQREFVATEPLAGLAGALGFWAAGPVDLNALLILQERYEKTGELRYASAIAQAIERMKWSEDAERRELAQQLQQHYQGANMRIAVSAELMNRLVPKEHKVDTPVRERIAGKKVQGRSHTTTNVRVQLLPDPEKWKFGLEAVGRVNSQTRSETWPVWVRNASKFQYEAVKIITIDEQGLRVTPAKAEAKGRNDLTGVASDFDPVPILGNLLRDAARRQHQKSRPQALSQVRAKVAQQAQQRMDMETDAKLHDLEVRFRNTVLSPLEQLALAADAVDMSTTEDRAVMQLRLANLDQLSAHTPRPSAPSDSLASLQLHESVLNNAAAGLGLDGRRLTLLELYDFFADKLGHMGSVPPEDLPRRATIEFAPHDAVHIGLDGDRLELVLNIREMGQGRDKIQNFRVHAFYRPVVDGLDVRLVRDETLQFSGRYLRTGPRVVLHSVMGKFFSKGQEISLLNSALANDPRLNEMMVTQLVIDDGWLAVALGPEHAERKAWRTARYELEDEPMRR